MENGHPFPEILNDGYEIAAFIETFALYEVDEEFVAEQFRDDRAVLKLIPMDQLHEGGRDANLQVPANEKKYQKMDLQTLPPLLVRDGKVLDGNHRYRASQKRGLTSIWCYVVEDAKGNNRKNN